MSDFEYDCLEKKRIAQQAKYRKNGSKSKKCSLPSDKLTHKEWKERCGEVVSYNLGRPMSWDDFKKLPKEMQSEYLAGLRTKFQVTSVELGKMFGVKALTVRRHVENNSLGITFPRGYVMSKESCSKWNAFISGVEECQEDMPVEAETSVAQTWLPAAGEMSSHQESVADSSHVNNKQMSMKMFCLQFSGAIDVDAIANSLKLILGHESNGEIEIVCNLS